MAQPPPGIQKDIPFVAYRVARSYFGVLLAEQCSAALKGVSVTRRLGAVGGQQGMPLPSPGTATPALHYGCLLGRVPAAERGQEGWQTVFIPQSVGHVCVNSGSESRLDAEGCWGPVEVGTRADGVGRSCRLGERCFQGASQSGEDGGRQQLETESEGAKCPRWTASFRKHMSSASV